MSIPNCQGVLDKTQTAYLVKGLRTKPLQAKPLAKDLWTAKFSFGQNIE